MARSLDELSEILHLDSYIPVPTAVDTSNISSANYELPLDSASDQARFLTFDCVTNVDISNSSKFSHLGVEDEAQMQHVRTVQDTKNNVPGSSVFESEYTLNTLAPEETALKTDMNSTKADFSEVMDVNLGPVNDHELHESAKQTQHDNRRNEVDAVRKLAVAADGADADSCSSSQFDTDATRAQSRRRSRIDYAKMHEGAIYFNAKNPGEAVKNENDSCDWDRGEAAARTSLSEQQTVKPKRTSLASKSKQTQNNKSKALVVPVIHSETVKQTTMNVENPASGGEDEEDEDSEEDEEEEDTSTLYCLCRKPYGKRFMIACDRCNEWFHGDCVGVSRRRGRQLAEHNAEFICPLCAARARIDVQHADEPPAERDRRFEAVRSQLYAEAQAAVASHDTNDSKPPAKAAKAKPNHEAAAQSKSRDQDDRKQPKSDASAPKKAKRENSSNSRSGDTSSDDEEDNLRLSDLRRKVAVAAAQSDVDTKVSADTQQSNKSKPAETTSTIASLKTEETETTVRRCRAKSCGRALTTQSAYCGRRCTEAYVREALQTLRKSNRNAAQAEYDRVPVIDRRLGKMLRGSEAPTVSNLVAFLERYATFEVILPTSSVVSSASAAAKSGSNSAASVSSAASRLASATAQRKQPTAAYAKPTVSSSTKLRTPVSNVPKPNPSLSKAAAPPSKPESSALPVSESRLAVRRDIGRTLNEQAEKADDVYLSTSEIRKLAVAIEDALHTAFGAAKQSDLYRARAQRLVNALRESAGDGMARRVLNALIKPADLVRLSEEELRGAPPKRVGTTSMHSIALPKPPAVVQPVASASNNQLATKAATKSAARDTTSEHSRHAFDFDCKICLEQARKDEQDRRRAAETAEQHAKASIVASSAGNSSAADGEQRRKSVSEAAETSSTAKSRNRGGYTVDTIRVEVPFESHPLSSVLPTVWHGSLSCNEFDTFSARLLPVSGQLASIDLPEKLRLCGRIDDRNVLRYLVSVRRSANRTLSIGRLIASSASDVGPFRAFCCSFVNRSRFGVVAFPPPHVKDLYIAPIDVVPDEMLPFEGPGLSDLTSSESNSNSTRGSLIKLLCIVIKHREVPATSPAPSGSSASTKVAAPAHRLSVDIAHPDETVAKGESFYQPPVTKRSRLSRNSESAPISPPTIGSPNTSGGAAGRAAAISAPDSPPPSDDPFQSANAAAAGPKSVPIDSSPSNQFALPAASVAAPVSIPLSNADAIVTTSVTGSATITATATPTSQGKSSDLREMISTVSSIVNLIQKISYKQNPATSSATTDSNTATARSNTSTNTNTNTNTTPTYTPAAATDPRSKAMNVTPGASVGYPFSVSQQATRQMLTSTIRSGTPSNYTPGGSWSSHGRTAPPVRSSLDADDEYTPDFVASDYRPSQDPEYRPQPSNDMRSKSRSKPGRSRWDK